MPHLSPSLAALVARRHGIVAVADLLADGLSASTIRRLVTARVLVRCHEGVYRVATAPDTFEARCGAVSAADPTVVVTGRAAGRLWGFRHLGRPVEQPIVLVDHGSHAVSGAVLVRRTNVLTDDDWLERPDGIRVATPARAWFDCARDVNDTTFEHLTEWVLDHHGGVPVLWEMRRRLDAGGRPGLRRVNRVLSQRPAWQRPADSKLELRVLNALAAAGVAGLVRQHPIRLPDGVTVHPDGALPGIRWALEIDHVTWHGGRLDAQRDKARDRQLRRLRWQVDRVTDHDVSTRFEATIAELVELVALRRRELAA